MMTAEALKISVDFYYGLGSRYSYLAASQIPRIEAAGASIQWRPIYSPDLIQKFGEDPFRAPMRRGQYRSEYRTEDASRWAAHYGVPYIEPDFEAVDWRQAALWASAARMLSGGDAFGAFLLSRCFAEGRPPAGIDDLRDLSGTLGLCANTIEQVIESGEADRQHSDTVARAVASGAFGVPTFVTDDGALFWGQDRIPLLLDHIRRLAGLHFADMTTAQRAAEEAKQVRDSG